MNDEATRKFIQALKRLMTFCQRRYPTDPSRCVDFDGFSNAGRGAVGGGGDKAVRGQWCRRRRRCGGAWAVVARCASGYMARRSGGPLPRLLPTRPRTHPRMHLQALLEALAKGEVLAIAPPPARIDPRSGKVKIPQKWDAKIRGALQQVEASDAAEEAAEAAEAAAERAA